MRYDYKCLNKTCGKSFDMEIPLSRVAKLGHLGVVCPACHSRNIRKVIRPTIVHFKGTGWGKDKK